MKNNFKIVIALLLAIILLLAAASCNGRDENDTTTTTTKLTTLGNKDDKPEADKKDEGNTDSNDDKGDESAQTDIVDGTYVLSDLVVIKKDGADMDTADIELMAGDERAAQSIEMGKLIYWNDQNWCGSTVNVEQAVRNGNEYTLAFTHTGECWYGFQLFYNPVGAVNGETYSVSFTIVSDVDARITVCGAVYDLVASREQTISYEVTLDMKPEATDYVYGQSAVSIQFGVEGN